MSASVSKILSNRTIWVNKKGDLHRIDGPAVERISGSKEWWLDGKLHREDGPAIENDDGTKE